MLEIIKNKGIAFFIKRFFDKFLVKSHSILNEMNDIKSCTFTENFDSDDVVCPVYDANSIRYDLIDKENIIKFANYIIEHKFNLLGSGLQEISYNSKYNGFEGYQYDHNVNYNSTNDLLKLSVTKYNYVYANNLAIILAPNYKPIDWQRDFRSGFRWNSLDYHTKIAYGDKPGVDVKLPWELGRLSHLTSLFYAWKFTNDQKYLLEYKSQIYDFIAFNPPKFGVQWKSAMDVALRAVNIIVSYTFFLSSGELFDTQFRKVIINYLYDHLLFISNNLEWSSGMRANHYFANICGLLYLSAFLPVVEETSYIFNFAFNELVIETNWQFNSDGGNFEASLPYHSFASEMLFQSYLLLSNLDGKKLAALVKKYESSISQKFKLNSDLKQRISKQHKPIEISNDKIVFPKKFVEKLKQIADFTINTLPHNLNDFQIGDNDDGYFTRFVPIINNDMSISAKNRTELFKIASYIASNSERKRFEMYNDFGLYKYCNSNYDICVRCGSVGQNGKGGHSHNDQLSFELYYGDILLICDAGTYNYTAAPNQRNTFRSTKSHNTLCIDGYEQNKFASGTGGNLFWLNDNSHAKVLNCSENSFSGIHYGYPSSHQRDYAFENDFIKISDYCKLDTTKKILIHLTHQATIELVTNKLALVKYGDFIFSVETENANIYFEEYEYSPTYGVKYLATVIVIESKEDAIYWSIRLKS